MTATTTVSTVRQPGQECYMEKKEKHSERKYGDLNQGKIPVCEIWPGHKRYK